MPAPIEDSIEFQKLKKNYYSITWQTRSGSEERVWTFSQIVKMHNEKNVWLELRPVLQQIIDSELGKPELRTKGS